jgi:hypothetical protein
MASPDAQASVSVGTSKSIPLHHQSEIRPWYFTALGLDRYGFEIGNAAWWIRAQELQRGGQLKLAAEAFEQCAQSYKDSFPFGASRPLAAAADCWKKVGRTDLARADQMQAAELKAERG